VNDRGLVVGQDCYATNGGDGVTHRVAWLDVPAMVDRLSNRVRQFSLELGPPQ
jgi:hypothetical protein